MNLKPLHVCLMALSTLMLVQSRQALSESAEIALTPSHIVVIEADTDFIWGSYYFAVNNKAKEPAHFETKVMLPQKVVEFKASSGITDQDLHKDSSDQLILEKEFPPGLSLIGVNFKVKVEDTDSAALTFEPTTELETFNIAVPSKSGLSIAAPNLKDGLNPMLGASDYKGLIGDHLAQAKPFTVTISGLPKGRGFLWYLGILTFLALVAGGVYLSSRSRKAEK